ncbi:MAG: Uma2 family endonuclease [Thermosynechococcaceae cyanobacterium]
MSIAKDLDPLKAIASHPASKSMDLAQIEEQRVTLCNITWPQYDTLPVTLDEVPGLRLTYLSGCLELYMPSPEHEQLKSILGRLLELYSIETQTRLYACGSTTYRKQAQERGLEPDKSYCVDELKDRPDLAIEVVLSSGGIDKLLVYQGLAIPEVWVWTDNTLQLYHLCNGAYQQVESSQVLPKLDIDLFVCCAQIPDQFDATVQYQQALRREVR